MKDGKECSQCLFAFRVEDPKGGGRYWFECRRFPPQLVHASRVGGRTAGPPLLPETASFWPKVELGDWCGEWK